MNIRRHGLRAALLAMLLAVVASCANDDAYSLITFNATASGLARPAAGPLTFTTALGWNVTLTSAQVSILAMYFHNAVPDDSPIAYDGLAVGEVLNTFVVDALDPMAYSISGGGKGINELAQAAELRFGPATTGPIAATGDQFALFYVAGSAVKNGVTVNFAGTVDFGNNPAESPYQNVADARLSYLAANFTPEENGTLTLQVDPSGWFDQVSFDQLGPTGAAATALHDFSLTQSAQEFRNGMASAANAYTFTFTNAP